MRWWWVCLVLAGLLAGCVQSGLVPCGELACPVGLVCTPGGCAAQEDVDVCVGLADGEACTSTRTPNGACHGGACRPVVCGDRVVDLGEACDDGNTVDGDACSATCNSDESCGNAFVDTAFGEDCDEGVRGMSNDGCSSTCKLELAGWRSVDPAPITGRTGVAMAYDAARGQMVLFGGYNDSGPLGDMWLFVDGTWRKRALGQAPAARAFAVMAYDEARERVILFGGQGNSGFYGDTWEWDGATWRELQPATSPSPRASGAADYDVDRQRIVMFGGTVNNSETWEWDGSTWIDRTTAAAPPPRIWTMLAYDRARGVTLLYGGLGTSNNGLTDTWTWDGTSWTQHTGGPTPPTSFGAVMAYDPRTLDGGTDDVVVLAAGRNTSFANVSMTWWWNGTQWSDRSAGSGLRWHGRAVYDAGLRQVLVFGGIDYPSYLADTILWNGGLWQSPPLSSTAPAPCGGAALTYDARRGEVLMFGGYSTTPLVYYDELWSWRDGAWTRRTNTGPAQRSGASLTYDPVRDRTVLFGGFRFGDGHLSDTWEWDGASWTQHSPSVSPPARNTHGAAFDETIGRVVIFGGYGTTDDRTWAWDGTTWTELATQARPPARGGTRLAYDAARRRIVLFGGDGGYGDTWLFDGANWTEAQPANAPTPRSDHAMYYDPIRERVVVAGGSSESTHSDTWEWDGTTWTARPELGNVAHSATGVAYGAIERRPIAFGGFATTTTYSTRSLVYSTPFAIDEQCRAAGVDDDGDGLAGCDDPDCWGRCAPLCPPTQTCPPTAPQCGDGTCSAVEDALLCPADCT